MKKVIIVLVLLCCSCLWCSERVEFPKVRDRSDCRLAGSGLVGFSKTRSNLTIKKFYRVPVQNHLDVLNDYVRQFVSQSQNVLGMLQALDYNPLPLEGEEKVNFLNSASIILKKIALKTLEAEKAIASASGKIEAMLSDEEIALYQAQEKSGTVMRPDFVNVEQNGAIINNLLQAFFRDLKGDNADLKWLVFYFTFLSQRAKQEMPVTVRLNGWHKQIEEHDVDVRALQSNFAEFKKCAEELYSTVMNDAPLSVTKTS